jgi:hypothetical protein
MEQRAVTLKLPEPPKTRFRLVAEEYQRWLEENPKAPKKKKLRMFDQISDEIYGR